MQKDEHVPILNLLPSRDITVLLNAKKSGVNASIVDVYAAFLHEDAAIETLFVKYDNAFPELAFLDVRISIPRKIEEIRARNNQIVSTIEMIIPQMPLLSTEEQIAEIRHCDNDSKSRIDLFRKLTSCPEDIAVESVDFAEAEYGQFYAANVKVSCNKYRMGQWLQNIAHVNANPPFTVSYPLASESFNIIEDNGTCLHDTRKK